MSEPSPASEWAPPPRRSFSTLVTVVCSIVAILYIGLLGRPLVEPRVSPLAELEHPAESLERLVTRELDLRAAMRGGPRWEWRLYRALSGDEDPLAAAGDWYAELVAQTDSPLAELHRAIILGRGGPHGPGPRGDRGAGRGTGAARADGGVGDRRLCRPAPRGGRRARAHRRDRRPPRDLVHRHPHPPHRDADRRHRGARAGRGGHPRARPGAAAPRAGPHGGLPRAARRREGSRSCGSLARRGSVQHSQRAPPPALELRRRLCALRARPRRAAGHRARGLHRAPTGNGVRHRARHGGGPAALLVGDPLPPPARHVDAGDLRPRAAPRGLGAAPRRDARAHRRGARERHPHRRGEPPPPPQDALDGRLHRGIALGRPPAGDPLDHRRHGVGARRGGDPVPRAPLRDLAHPDRRAGIGPPERDHLHAAAWLRDRRIAPPCS